jgi:hypothetical protein
MPYSVQPIILRNGGVGLTTPTGGTTGFPSAPFNYLLFSKWVCLGAQPRSAGINNNISFMNVTSNNSSVQVQLLGGTSVNLFNGTFSAPIGNVLSHILVSADPATQRLQVYVNDAPVTTLLGTGGPGWIASGPFHIGFNAWNIGGAGSTAPGSGLADLFIAAPAAFFDLGVVANRRKFINRDLTPVDLGANASAVLGAAPPIWLTVRPGGVPNDFGANNGTGGAFTITAPPLAFQAAGVCVAATPPPPEPVTLAMDDLVVTAEADMLSENLVSLRWSDDRGHSWGSPVSQSIGEAGEYRTSHQWQRLGMSRFRVFEISWSVPLPTALMGCFVDATPAQS